MKRDAIDFHAVESAHHAMHDRLTNWATWANGRPGSEVHAMFRLYKPDQRDRAAGGPPVDQMDAQRIQKGVADLPAGPRQAVTWCYVAPCSPLRMARQIGVGLRELQGLVDDARRMLVDRGV